MKKKKIVHIYFGPHLIEILDMSLFMYVSNEVYKSNNYVSASVSMKFKNYDMAKAPIKSQHMD